MLERPPRFVLVMAGQVHLSVFAGDLAFTVDNDCRVEMADPAILFSEFRIAEVEPDAELRRFIKERLGGGAWHLFLEEGIDVRFIFHPVARKERGQREFWIDDQIRPRSFAWRIIEIMRATVD